MIAAPPTPSVLPDYLRTGLDLVFVGINPGTRSAATGHHYAGSGNHFWPLLHEAGFVDEPLTYANDARILEWNIGVTNMVDRASPSISDLSLAELRDGAAALREKLLRVQPRFAFANPQSSIETAGELQLPGLGCHRRLRMSSAMFRVVG